MQNLIEDVQIQLLSYLFPQEIIYLHISCLPFQQMLDELSTHKGFAVHCTTYVNKNVIIWFQEHQIRLHLLQEYRYKNFKQMWYKNGLLHRDNDLPAIIYDSGTQIWCQNGKKHRFNDLPTEIWLDCTEIWYQKGKLHRENDLPALIKPNGVQAWYQNGQYHRDNDLPALIRPDGCKGWYQRGLIHRDNDLPAFIYPNGSKNGFKMEFNKNKILFLFDNIHKLKYGFIC